VFIIGFIVGRQKSKDVKFRTSKVRSGKPSITKFYVDSLLPEIIDSIFDILKQLLIKSECPV